MFVIKKYDKIKANIKIIKTMKNFDFTQMHSESLAREKFASDFLLSMESKWLIEKWNWKLLGETKVKLLNLHTFFWNNPQKLREWKKKIEKELIIEETKIKKEYEHSEIKINDIEVQKIQNELYEKLSIKKKTYQNSETSQFIKWIIDVSLLQNADLIMYLKNNWTELIVKIFDEISKMNFSDVLKIFAQIIEWIGKSIWDLFVWNAYEKWKSVAELGLSTAVFLTIWKKILKKWAVKEISKIELNSIKKTIPKNIPAQELKNEIPKINEKILEEKTSDTLKISPILSTNQHEFREKIIEILNSDKNIKKIEIPHDRKTKELINSIVSENYPLIEVMRLVPGETVTNITFSWIKKLNDNLGQNFTDTLLEKLQDNIKNNFKKNTTWLKESSRIIRTNYKNLTFSSPNINVGKSFFEWKNKDEIISNLITELNPDIEKISIKLWKDKSEIETLIRENLDFAIWESILKKWATDKEKLKVFYEAEISSREWIGKSWLDSTKFNLKNIENHSIKARNKEFEIIEKYYDKEFEFNKIRYKAIVKDINWITTINPILLRYVRKYGETWLVNPPELNELTKNYINELNSWFDFISPSINLDKDLIIAKKINSWIKKWSLDIEDLVYTYKWTLSRESFFEITKWRSWMSAFIDIKDMWIDNLGEFKILWDKLLDWKLAEDDLLKAWNKVTKKFIDTVKSLKEIYWDKIQISLGWDEIYLFIEWVSKNEEREILSNLNKVMNKNHLKSRISHNFDDWKWWKKDYFSKLDKLTSINKSVEEKIESLIIEKKMEHLLKVPDNISLNIEKWLENLVLWDLTNIINPILQKIDKKIFDFITSPIEWKIFDLWIIWGTRIIFRWWKNSLMEININKI